MCIRDSLKRRTVSCDGKQFLRVAGRKYIHFVHKDAEKREQQSQLWFLALSTDQGSTDPKKTPWSQVRMCRNMLLDSLSWKEGDQGRGRMTAAKLMARLCLAFSTTYHVARCSPNVDEVLDLRNNCLLYTSPSPRDQRGSRMPSSA